MDPPDRKELTSESRSHGAAPYDASGKSFVCHHRLSRQTKGVFAAFFILVAFSVLLALNDKSLPNFLSNYSLKVAKKNPHSFCSSSCSFDVWGQGKRSPSPGFIADTLSRQREMLVSKLKLQYGEKYFDEIFVDSSANVSVFDNTSTISYGPFVPATKTGKSAILLKRKISKKLLGLILNNDRETKYVWATGGHSAAAGHGNLFNESYTAHLEKNMQLFFNSIGVDFQARNYAMGATSSFPEMSLCWNEIYGTDVDFFSWDFGMTDGSSLRNRLNYGYAGATSPGRPAMVALKVGKSSYIKPWTMLESIGGSDFFPVFVMGNRWKSAIDAIPNSDNRQKSEVDALPVNLQNFKCEDTLGKCPGKKYSRICGVLEGEAGWHPGFKQHALIGAMLSLFLADAFVAAAKELDSMQVAEDASLYLDKMQKDEEDAFHRFQEAAARYTPGNNKLQLAKSEMWKEILVGGPSVCHIARLPAQTRYLGHLTASNKTGGPAALGQELYDVGLDEEKFKNNPTSGKLELVYRKKDHRKMARPKKGGDCPFLTVADYKDHFFAMHGSGWVSMMMPNHAEEKAYLQGKHIQGVVVFIDSSCNWRNCEEGHLKLATPRMVEEKKVEMRINGLEVVRLGRFGDVKDATVPWNKDGKFFPTDKMPFVIELKINEPGSFIKVTSITLM